jgi:hypothetical protein
MAAEHTRAMHFTQPGTTSGPHPGTPAHLSDARARRNPAAPILTDGYPPGGARLSPTGRPASGGLRAVSAADRAAPASPRRAEVPSRIGPPEVRPSTATICGGRLHHVHSPKTHWLARQQRFHLSEQVRRTLALTWFNGCGGTRQQCLGGTGPSPAPHALPEKSPPRPRRSDWHQPTPLDPRAIP